MPLFDKSSNDPDEIANEAINALLKEKEVLVKEKEVLATRLKQLEETKEGNDSKESEKLRMAQKRVQELEPALKAMTEKAAKLEEQNHELVKMMEVQQEAYERQQTVLDNERAANKRIVQGDQASEAVKVDVELGRMEIEKLTKRINNLSALEKEQAQLLEETEAESAKLKATLAARETTISKHKAYETELEASIADLEAINKLLEDKLESVQKDCDEKLSELLADQIAATNGSKSTAKQLQTQPSAVSEKQAQDEGKHVAKLHEEEMAQLKKEYERQLERKSKELEDVKAQMAKTRQSIIEAAGDQAAMMESVINEAEQLVEAERIKYDEILLTASAKHKLELDKLHAAFDADLAVNQKEFKRLEAELETVYAKHQQTLEDTRAKHAKALDMVEKSFEQERSALEAAVEAERAKAADQMRQLQDVTEEEVELERDRANTAVAKSKKVLAEVDQQVAEADRLAREEAAVEIALLKKALEAADENAKLAAKEATVALNTKMELLQMEVDQAQDKFANMGTEMMDARAKLRKENTDLRAEHRKELESNRLLHRKELDEMRTALKRELEEMREEKKMEVAETSDRLTKEMLQAEAEHTEEVEALQKHHEALIEARIKEHESVVTTMKQQMAKELAASQSKFAQVSSDLVEARAKMRKEGEELRLRHQTEMDKVLAEKQATVEKITTDVMKEVKEMSEAHTREVLELKANASAELDTMMEEHIKEKEEVEREHAARLERETSALKRQMAMEVSALTKQLETMQAAMENELSEERQQIDETKQKWAAELANLEAETLKTEAERQMCQEAMRKDFEDRDAFIVRIEEELRARTEDNAFYEKQNSELQEKLDELTSSTAEEIERTATLFEANMADMDRSYTAQIEEITVKYEDLLKEYNSNIDAANNALTQLSAFEATKKAASKANAELADLQEKFSVLSDIKANLEVKVKEQADALQAWYCRKCYLTVND